MKQPPLFATNEQASARWMAKLKELNYGVVPKGEPTESNEATHQTLSVEHMGMTLFWFEIAKQKPSGRLLIAFGSASKGEGFRVYQKAQEWLIEAGAHRLGAVTPQTAEDTI
jgi:hypothetical protein